MTKKKKICRLIYQIEIELFQEQSCVRGRPKPIPLVITKRIDGNKGGTDTACFSDTRIADSIEYLDKHLPAEFDAVINWMFLAESGYEQEVAQGGKDSEKRELLLERYRREADTRARARLSTNKGRPMKDREPAQECLFFMSEARSILLKLRKKKRNGRVFKSDFAKEYYKNDPKGLNDLYRNIERVFWLHRTSWEDIQKFA